MGMEHLSHPLRRHTESTTPALPNIISLVRNSSWVNPNSTRDRPRSEQQNQATIKDRAATPWAAASLPTAASQSEAKLQRLRLDSTRAGMQWKSPNSSQVKH